MKKRIVSAFFLVGVLVEPALAADMSAYNPASVDPQTGSPWGDIVAANNQISVDFLGADFNYAEIGDGRLGTATGKLDTETRWVPGVAFSYSLMQNWFVDNLYFNAQASWNSGDTHYVGAKIGGVYGSVVAGDGAAVFDTDVRLGKGFAVSPNFMLTPFLGAGSNYWDRRVNAGETYTNGYAGAGLMAQYAPAPKLVLSANALVGATFDSRISVAGPLGFSGGLGSSALWKLGLGADYAIYDNIHVNAGVDYVNFRYGESAIYFTKGFAEWEPNSRTSDVLLKAGVGYAF